ncbi:hypothetical protein BROUX41_006784 [Berkeleyomyces rouxiae]|uniref:uncharacterized protein n=1 Tax=Berkeleyomyces rouxiae TaxID=2035830 RepID=UPI003B797525
MAPLSPRRSSRARIPNTLTLGSAPSAAALASIASSRPERTTRSNRPSSTKSTPSASLSSESPDDYDDIHILRSTRRRGPDDDSSMLTSKARLSRRDTAATAAATTATMASHNNDDIQEDDEAVRCVCGFDDYPGPPPLAPQPADTATTPSSSAKRARDRDRDSASESDFLNGIEVNEDVSGFYVQCDVCKVWQHGACVGIMTEESSPDEYYCEQCRKDLHKIHVASNGQRYSHYTYATLISRSASRAVSSSKDKDKDGASTSRSGRLSTASQTAKRRSTMNSRDAAYDEEEELRRAIEASKEDAPTEGGDTNSRRLKRGRSHSEEKNNSAAKRLRTSSPSGSAHTEKSEPSPDDSEDSLSARNAKKSRQSRSQRENSERHEKERQRQEAANKRRVRADRRRADGSAGRDSEKDDSSVDSKEPDETLASAAPEVPAGTETSAVAPVPPKSENTTTDVDSTPAPVVASSETLEKATATPIISTTDIVETSTNGTLDKKTIEKKGIEKTEPETEKAPVTAVKTASNLTRGSSAPASNTSIANTPETPPIAMPAPAPAASVPASAPISAPSPAPAAAVKKSTKNNKKGRGRNQYTRDRDDMEDSPVRTTRESRHKASAHDNSHSSSNGHTTHASNGSSSRHSRSDDARSAAHAKGKHAAGKLSIPDLKRRSAAFLDFIQKTQLELAAEATPSRSASSTSSDAPSREASLDGLAAAVADAHAGAPRAMPVRQATPEPSTARKDFGDLTCGEMMDVLTRDLLKWQNQYLS